MTIWPELDTMSSREKNPQRISREDADELNFNIFPYWMERNILEATRSREGNPPCMKLFERIVFFIASKAGTISHTVPCYTTALEKGLEWLIAEAAGARAETGRGKLHSQPMKRSSSTSTGPHRSPSRG